LIIRAITITSKKVLDKYSIHFYNGSCLTLSSNPDSPQGVSMWGDTFGINDSHFEEAAESKDHIIPGTDEKLINWLDLPSELKSHIEKRISESK